MELELSWPTLGYSVYSWCLELLIEVEVELFVQIFGSVFGGSET